MSNQAEKIQVLGYVVQPGEGSVPAGSLFETDVGVKEGLEAVGRRVGTVMLGSLGDVIGNIVAQLDESLQGRTWTANVKLQFGVGAAETKIGGEISLQVSPKLLA